MPRSRFVAAGLLAVALPAVALACLWDYDTLKQERARFPDTLELITGKFLRHSKEFYEWRIQDRLKKLQTDPKNLAYYDDLAVAYDKTGQHDKAIETMLDKEKLKPGLYETYANLGTFYFHSAKLEEGLPYIDKALAINPDAHFGRERYQKWLVEYAISRRDGERIPLPLRPSSSWDWSKGDPPPTDFAAFVRRQLGKSRNEKLTDAETLAAAKGILGMMRFGHYDSPILLEALGDLLVGGPYGATEREGDAKRLAARAYLKASYETKDETAKKAYRNFAHEALQMQIRDPNTHESLRLEDLEGEFKRQLEDAEQWYFDLQGRELNWIRDGMNPEAEFDQLYTQEPTAAGEPSDDVEYSRFRYFLKNYPGGATAVGVILAALLLLTAFVVRRYRRARRRA
jgi:tetratricopeptide (TPR) repeat protein